MTYTSNLGAVTARFEEARRGALYSAAQVLRTRIVKQLEGGYTSGEYTNGNVAGSVTISPITVTPSGGEVTVGTNVKYALYWELGHWAWPAYYSEKLGRWVSVTGVRNQRTWRRKEVWMPALAASANDMRDAYARVMRNVLGGSAVVGNIDTRDIADLRAEANARRTSGN